MIKNRNNLSIENINEYILKDSDIFLAYSKLIKFNN